MISVSLSFLFCGIKCVKIRYMCVLFFWMVFAHVLLHFGSLKWDKKSQNLIIFCRCFFACFFRCSWVPFWCQNGRKWSGPFHPFLNILDLWRPNGVPEPPWLTFWWPFWSQCLLFGAILVTFWSFGCHFWDILDPFGAVLVTFWTFGCVFVLFSTCWYYFGIFFDPFGERQQRQQQQQTHKPTRIGGASIVDPSLLGG